MHFTGQGKPWLVPSIVKEPKSSLQWWWHVMDQLNRELDMGLDFEHWDLTLPSKFYLIHSFIHSFCVWVFLHPIHITAYIAHNVLFTLILVKVLARSALKLKRKWLEGMLRQNWLSINDGIDDSVSFTPKRD